MSASLEAKLRRANKELLELRKSHELIVENLAASIGEEQQLSTKLALENIQLKKDLAAARKPKPKPRSTKPKETKSDGNS